MFDELIKEYRKKSNFNKLLWKLLIFEMFVICFGIINYCKFHFESILYIQFILLFINHLYFVKIYYKNIYMECDRKILEKLLNDKKIYSIFFLSELKKYIDNKNDKSLGSIWLWWCSLFFSLFLKCMDSSNGIFDHINETYTITIIFFGIVIFNYLYYYFNFFNNKYMLYSNLKEIYEKIYLSKIEKNNMLNLINNISTIFEKMKCIFKCNIGKSDKVNKLDE